MAFLRVLLWEFVQNQVAIVVLAAVTWLWPRNRNGAVVLSIAGGVLAALVVHVTEPLKTPTAVPGWEGTLLNALLFVGAIQALAAYLHTRWGNWRSDLLMGGGLGLLLGLVQAVTATDVPIGIVIWHAVALILAGAVVLVVLRLVLTRLARAPLPWMLAGTVLIGAVMTTIIAVIDYSYLI